MSLKAALLTCVRVLQFLSKDLGEPWRKVQIVLNGIYVFIYCKKIEYISTNIYASKLLLIEQQRRVLWDILSRISIFVRNFLKKRNNDCNCAQGTLISQKCGHRICLKCYLMNGKSFCEHCKNILEK